MAPHDATSAVFPDLIFALVSPVGTDGPLVRTKLQAALSTYGYVTRPIKLSLLLEEKGKRDGKTISSAVATRKSELMTYGDQLCEETDEASAVALLGVAEILRLRAADAPEQVRTAYVIDSLKRPAEVTLLRGLYGDHLLVLGLQQDVVQREKRLVEMSRPSAGGKQRTEVASGARELIERDRHGGHGEFGQNTRQTFPMADVFLDLDAAVDHQINRVIDLLFGNPSYEAPTDDEYGMMLASLASTRSPELGLKVGAALFRGRSLLGAGANEHPAQTTTPLADQGSLDITELIADTVERLLPELNAEAQAAHDTDRSAYIENLQGTILKGSQIRSLVEFQRPVHAEMNALLDALGLGHAVAAPHIPAASRLLYGTPDPTELKLYVTAFPCHNCAKHLVQLGVAVIYLEPYPKSRAEAMYGEAVSERFTPFNGIAPQRYHALFDVSQDRKGPDGAILQWNEAERRAVTPRLGHRIDVEVMKSLEAAAAARLTAHGHP